VVGGLDNVEIVLDHHNRVALLDQSVEHFQQLADILEMQARGGFVKDVERLVGATLANFVSELHTLRLAARQHAPHVFIGQYHPTPNPLASAHICVMSVIAASS
jgi:hypothetical protein